MDDPFADFVPHPRYGRSPIVPGEEVPPDLYRDHWRYSSQAGHLYTKTAILADLDRQTPCPVPLPAYVDMRVDCRTCGRPFLFFAREQKHWYKELGFPLDARCMHCPECRKQNQRTQRSRERLADLSARQDELDDAGRMELAELLAEFLCRGEVKRPDKVRRALNRITDRDAFADRIAAVRRRIGLHETEATGDRGETNVDL